MRIRDNFGVGIALELTKERSWNFIPSVADITIRRW